MTDNPYITKQETPDIYFAAAIVWGAAQILQTTTIQPVAGWLKIIRTYGQKVYNWRFDHLDRKEQARVDRRVENTKIVQNGVDFSVTPATVTVDQDLWFDMIARMACIECKNCNAQKWWECSFRKMLMQGGAPALEGNPKGHCQYAYKVEEENGNQNKI